MGEGSQWSTVSQYFPFLFFELIYTSFIAKRPPKSPRVQLPTWEEMLLEQRTWQTTWKQAARQSLCNASHSVNNKTDAEEEEDCKLEVTKYHWSCHNFIIYPFGIIDSNLPNYSDILSQEGRHQPKWTNIQTCVSIITYVSSSHQRC